MITLETLERYFTEAEEASRDSRQVAERCRDYYDNKQITADELKILKARKQPPVVFNKVAQKIDFLLGTERKARTDPKAYPRTPEHDEAANAVTDAIRYVLDNNDFDVIASNVFESMLIEGTGASTVEVEARPNGDISVAITPVAWDRFGYDPYSRRRDFSDANYTFVISWMDADKVKAKWKGKAEVVETSLADASDTYDDKPTHWFNKSRRRVMVVEMYHLTDKWERVVFCKGCILEPSKPSPYLDGDDLPSNPHIAASAKVKRDGQRYGAAEAMLDPQDEINKRRSKSLHILTTKQTFSKEGQIIEINKFKKEANKPDGHLEFPNAGEFGKDFGIIPNESLVGPQFSMYQDAMSFMDTVQANAALEGNVKSMSGRAIQSLQQGGMVELTLLFDVHAQWKKDIYEAVWNRIRQFWREEKWIRVTDNEDNLRFVGLNQPVTLAEQRIAQETGAKVSQVRKEFADELAQMYQMQPALQAVAEVENELAVMEVDIIIEEVPDVVNLQSEQFDLLVQMYQAAPDKIDFEDIVAMSTLRNKDKILKKDLEPEEQAQAQAAQEKAEELDGIAKAQAIASIQSDNAKASKDMADAESTSLETEIVKRQVLGVI